MASKFPKLFALLADFPAHVESGEFRENGVKLSIALDSGGVARLSTANHEQRDTLMVEIVNPFREGGLDEEVVDGILIITFAI